MALDGALATLLTEWRVLHVVMDGLPEAEQRRASLPAELRDRYEPVSFLGGGAMEAALVSADLMLGRAGASTIAEAAAAGLPAIIVPYPFAGGLLRHERHRRCEARETWPPYMKVEERMIAQVHHRARQAECRRSEWSET